MKATVHETGEGTKQRVPYLQGLSEVFKMLMKEHTQPDEVVEPETTLPPLTPSVGNGCRALHHVHSATPRSG